MFFYIFYNEPMSLFFLSNNMNGYLVRCLTAGYFRTRNLNHETIHHVPVGSFPFQSGYFDPIGPWA